MDLFSTCRRKWKKCLLTWWHCVLLLKVHYLTDVLAQRGGNLKYWLVCWLRPRLRHRVWTCVCVFSVQHVLKHRCCALALCYTAAPLVALFYHGVFAHAILISQNGFILLFSKPSLSSKSTFSRGTWSDSFSRGRVSRQWWPNCKDLGWAESRARLEQDRQV